MSLVSKYLREKGSSLSKENFGFEKKFLGFDRKQETISVCENYHGQVSDRQSQDHPPKQSKFVWLRGGRLPGLQCLLCNKTYGGRRAMTRHVAATHPGPQDPKHVCSKCGQRFTQKFNMKVHIENDKCKKTNIRTAGSKQKSQPTDITGGRAEEPKIPGQASARVLIECPDVAGIRKVQVKLSSSRVIGDFLASLLASSGYSVSQVDWLCEGKVLSGGETAGSLHNKSVKFRIKE